jgi:plastocyanin
MRPATKLTIVAVMGLCLTAIGAISQGETAATAAVEVQQAGPKITITVQAANSQYTYEPAQLTAKVGETITVTNNDPNGVHSVTAEDGTFNVEVPPNSSMTLTVQKPGSFPYYCTYHSGQHNPASINVS